MDFNKAEIDAVKETLEQPTQTVVDLSELQLAVVGGGCGEVTPY
jgi:hypothetical protein